VALAFGEQRAHVVVADRNVDSALETVKFIRDEGGIAEAMFVDVCDEQSIGTLVEQVLQGHGRIDILHNNVGIGHGDGSVVDLPVARWDQLLATNLTSIFLTCKAVLPTMVAQRSGIIINVSSIGSLMALAGVGYKVSKAGVNAMTEQMAYAYAEHGIRVNAILPGHVATPMAIEGTMQVTNLSRAELLRIKDEEVPLRHKQGSATDIAKAAVFLASDESEFITGALLVVDGGQTLRVG
jgi:NAD(P)-dependent dehydrogenase (short-subunit alcohol dehydrogenase family)